MRGNYRIFIQDRLTRSSFIVSVILLLVSSCVVGVTYFQLPPLIPFFNSFPWGAARLTPSYFALFLPVAFVGVLLLNLLLAIAIYSRYTIIARILSINTFLFIFFGLVAYFQILILIF